MSDLSQATIRIGTRGSPLALAQAEIVRDLLHQLSGLEKNRIILLPIRTSGDRLLEQSLANAGGKGLFTKELDEALTAGTIDLAVHSMKDVPTLLPPSHGIAAVLPREDVRDALIAGPIRSIADLPQRARVGTASLRRQAQLLRRRPDLQISVLRGNVETRLRKVESGALDATLLAMAGLKRLGLATRASAVIAEDQLLPAVAQGAIGLQCLDRNHSIRDLLTRLNHGPSHDALKAERAMLAVLDGSCRTPIAGYAHFLPDGALTLAGEILKPDGSQSHSLQLTGTASDPEALGRQVGAELKRRGGGAFFTKA